VVAPSWKSGSPLRGCWPIVRTASAQLRFIARLARPKGQPGSCCTASAWRCALTTGLSWEGRNGGPVEADEAFIGGEPKNRHKDKRPRTPKYLKDPSGYPVRNPAYKSEACSGTRKIPVFGLLGLEVRQVRAMVVPDVNRETSQNEILNNVSKSSRIYTDAHKAYTSLSALEFVHGALSHVDEYVRGESPHQRPGELLEPANAGPAGNLRCI
jgi:hypothetical protein